MSCFNRFITSPQSLVTSHSETRAGFLRIALEKNRVSDPYVKNALAFKAMTVGITDPETLQDIHEVRPFLLTAAGLSEKSLTYLTIDDQSEAVRELIEKFLKPAGISFIDEVIYRYLLIKGDAVGGTMRNRIGTLGQERFIRALISVMNVQNMHCDKLPVKCPTWQSLHPDSPDAEAGVKALRWENQNGQRVLVLNATIPAVKKNVDLCLFKGNISDYNHSRLVSDTERAIMFWELKGGIDPAGADEHWKTAKAAIERIRLSFARNGRPDIMTSFVGAAIEKSMAEEIYSQLEEKTLSNAANLTDNNQLTEFCLWLIAL